MSVPRITLLTDFGTRDPYVASMKGVIASMAPDAIITDLTHEIAPGDVLEGSLFLATAVPHFPSKTIHVAIIDPGVGTARKALAARVGEQVVLCPDNGLLTGLARYHPVDTPYAIENPTLVRGSVSATFHGRDVFAPVAAHLARGIAIENVGPVVDQWIQLHWPEPTQAGQTIAGEVLHIDRFGNAITNIPRAMIPEPENVVIETGAQHVRLHRTYGDVPIGAGLAVIGSTEYIELSIHGGSTAETWGLKVGSAVRVVALR